MNRTFAGAALVGAAWGLAACGGNDDDAAPKVTVDDLPIGSYVVSLGDADAPTVGKYYAADDGSRLLVVADGTDHAERLYRRNPGDAWVAVPASDLSVNVRLLHSDALAVGAATLASVAGSYVTQAADGVTATFTVTAAATSWPARRHASCRASFPTLRCRTASSSSSRAPAVAARCRPAAAAC